MDWFYSDCEVVEMADTSDGIDSDEDFDAENSLSESNESDYCSSDDDNNKSCDGNEAHHEDDE